MDEVLERLLEAQLRHELSLWHGEQSTFSLRRLVAELFAWFQTVRLDDLVSRAQVLGLIERYVIELRVSGGITELNGELSRLVLVSRSTAETRVDGILTQESYADFAEKIVSLEGVRRELIALAAQSSTFTSIGARLLARSLLDWLTPRVPLERGLLLGRAAEAAHSLGERLRVPLEERVLELVRLYLEQHRERVTRDIEQRLLGVLSPERLRSLLDELWDGIAAMPLSQAFELIGEQDLEDFVVLIHEFWMRYRKSAFFRSISREMVDHVFDKYGQEPLASVIDDLGVTEAMVGQELIGFLRPILEQAAHSGALERMLRSRLRAFYGSAAARAALSG